MRGLLYCILISMAWVPLSSSRTSWADPVPIVRNSNGDWIRDPSLSFPVSSVVLDIRRFAQLPDYSFCRGSCVARPTSMRYSGVPSDDRIFITLQRVSGTVQEVSADGPRVREFFSPRVVDERSLIDFSFIPSVTRSALQAMAKSTREATPWSLQRRSTRPGVRVFRPHRRDQ